jgi:hypothetical protein
VPGNVELDQNFNPASAGIIPGTGVVNLHLTNIQGPDANGQYYGDLVTSSGGGVGHVIVDSGTITIGTALPAGTAVIGHIIVDSGTVIANTGTGFPTAETFSTSVSGTPTDTWAYLGGGSVDSTGLPQGQNFQRIRAMEAKTKTTGSVTSTLAADTNLVFGSAPKVLQPGQTIILTGGATPEVAFISDAFVPSVSATTIALKYALVQAGNTTASFDTFSTFGPTTNAITWAGMTSSAMAVVDQNNGQQGFIVGNAGKDGASGSNAIGMNAMTYNNSSMDRKRGNLDNITLTTSAAVGSGTVNAADQVNYNGRGVKVYLNITAIGTGTVTVTVQGKDPVTSTYYTLLASAAVATTGFTVLEVYPGVGVTANLSASTTLPRTWRTSAVAAMSVGTVTYTISTSVIL